MRRAASCRAAARARHIAESLDNISVPAPDEASGFDLASLGAMRTRRQKAALAAPGW